MDENVKYCKRCFYSSAHPLNLTFDKEGVCSGCRVHEEKDYLDWIERGKLLTKILNSYRNKSGNNYDCIIPVSGARDSYFIVDIIKNNYGMNPLLVTYNKQYNTRIGIRNLAYLRIHFDCDMMTCIVNPKTVKKITKATLNKLGSIYWHCIAGQTVFPVQIAVKFKIPLIIWGAHQGIDQVGMFSHLDEVEMTRKYRKEHDLMGIEAEDLIGKIDEIKEEELVQYIYPNDKHLERVGVRGIYLNNYIRWDSKAQHEKMIQKYGYETTYQTRTFDTYNDVDCFHYSDIHDYIKYLKYGYGKVVDHATRELRLKRLTHEEGVELIQKHIDVKPKTLEQYLSWIGITKNGFEFLINQHRSPIFWLRNSDWEYKPKVDIISEMRKAADPKVALEKIERCNFIVTPSKEPNTNDDQYIIIGKGFVENEEENKNQTCPKTLFEINGN